MALQRDYEIPGTGLVAANAYHVVTNVKIDKRATDIPTPPDNSRPNGLTARAADTELYWKAGYIADISVTIWKDKNARESGARPIGFIGVSPSDNQYRASSDTEDMKHKSTFFLDVESEHNYLQQAYRHLLTTNYYSGSNEI